MCPFLLDLPSICCIPGRVYVRVHSAQTFVDGDVGCRFSSSPALSSQEMFEFEECENVDQHRHVACRRVWSIAGCPKLATDIYNLCTHTRTFTCAYAQAPHTLSLQEKWKLYNLSPALASLWRPRVFSAVPFLFSWFPSCSSPLGELLVVAVGEPVVSLQWLLASLCVKCVRHLSCMLCTM